jgi:hypothetical protein
VLEKSQQQRRRQPGNPGQQPDNDHRAQKFNIAAAHGVNGEAAN